MPPSDRVFSALGSEFCFTQRSSWPRSPSNTGISSLRPSERSAHDLGYDSSVGDEKTSLLRFLRAGGGGGGGGVGGGHDFGAGGVRCAGLAKNTGYATGRARRCLTPHGDLHRSGPGVAPRRAASRQSNRPFSQASNVSTISSRKAVEGEGEEGPCNEWSKRIPADLDLGWTQKTAYKNPIPSVPKNHPLYRAVQVESSRQLYKAALKQDGVRDAAEETISAWYADRGARSSERNRRMRDLLDEERDAIKKEVAEAEANAANDGWMATVALMDGAKGQDPKR